MKHWKKLPLAMSVLGVAVTAISIVPPAADAATTTGHVNLTTTAKPTVYVAVNDSIIPNPPTAGGFTLAGARTTPAVSVKLAAPQGTTANDVVVAYDNVTGAPNGIAALSAADSPTGANAIVVTAATRALIKMAPYGPGSVIWVNDSGVEIAHATVPHVLPGPSGCTNNWGDGTQTGGYKTNFSSYWGADPVVSTCATPIGRVGESYTPGYGVLDRTGMVGLGDVVITPDKASIIVANRNDGHLYTGPVLGTGELTQIASLPAFATDSDWRPAALTVHNDQILVGWTHISSVSKNTMPLHYAVAYYDPLSDTWKTAVAPQAPTGIMTETRSGPVNPATGVQDPVQMFGAYLSGLDVDSFGNLQVAFVNVVDQVKPATAGWGAEPVLVLPPTGVDTWSNNFAGATQVNIGALTRESAKAASFGHVIRNPLPQGNAAEMILTSEDPGGAFNSGGLAFLPDVAPATGTSQISYAYARRPDATDFLHTTGYNAGQTNDPYSFGKGNGMGAVALMADWAEFGDRIWADANANGLQDTGEASIAGVAIEILNANGTPYVDPNTGTAAIVVTDSLGRYTVVVPSDVPVRARLAASNWTGSGVFATGTYAGWGITTPVQGSDDMLDSNADPATRELLGAAGTAFPAGTIDYTFDAGVRPGVSVGDYAWQDNNRNGIQDAGEPALPGVTVTLTDSTGATSTTTTDSAGFYSFAGLVPSANYTLSFAPPTDWHPTAQNAPGSTAANDSNPNASGVVTFTAPASGAGSPATPDDPTLDAGFIKYNLSITKTLTTTGTILPGNPVTFSIVVHNDGPSSALAPITVKDLAASGLNITAMSGSGWSCITATATCTSTSGPLAAGADSAPITVTAAANASAKNVTYVTPNAGDVTETNVLGTPLPTATTDTATSATDNDAQASVTVTTPTVSVGDFVWLDTNANGIQDAGESGVAGVTATLYRSDGTTLVTTDALGNPVAPQVTDSAGAYRFGGLPYGTYVVKFSDLPTGYIVTTSADVVSVANDSNGLVATSRVLNAHLAGDRTLDLGLFQPVSVGDLVWVDANHNGTQDAGEPGVAGVTVTLYAADGTTLVTADASGNPITPATTDANGAYLFANLIPGQYVVQFSNLPTGYLVTTSADTAGTTNDSNGLTATSTVLASGESDTTLDLGVFLPVSVGDYVWVDANHNGTQDLGEPGVAGVTATLYAADGATLVTADASGNPITPATTDGNGAYLFANLIPGQYVVQFSNLPTGYLVTTSADTVGATNDSNGLTATSVMLASGESDTTLDLGLFLPVSVGDYVWVDANRNGIQDVGEPGVAGVTVTLYEADGVTPVTADANGNPITPQVTDNNGLYNFANLLPGQYQVVFSNLPAGFAPTVSADVVGGTTDSNGLTATSAVLASGQSDQTLDLGIFAPVSIGNYVWVDANHNGTQDPTEAGIIGVTATLYAADGTTPVTQDAYGNPIVPATTNGDGFYGFADLLPGTYVVKFSGLPTGYLVTISSDTPTIVNDSNGTTATSVQLGAGQSDLTLDLGVFLPVSVGDRVWVDTDHNGSQDAGEMGLGGVTVTLYAADGTTPVTTDASGNPINPATTDSNGAYLFTNLVPGQYVVHFSNLPAGYLVTTSADLVGAGTDSNGLSATSSVLASGEADLTLDLGVYQPVSVGDFVWEDLNRNGLQEAGERGLVGVRATLYGPDGTTLITSDASGNAVVPQLTDATGHYQFTNLVPGRYVVKFNNFPSGGYLVTTSADTANVATDSNGIVATSVLLTSGQSDQTLDLGIFRPVLVGNYVWEDLNHNGTQDLGEPGIPGVTATLYESDGTTLVTINARGLSVTPRATSASGIYQFTNLVPGSYVVKFSNLPSGYLITTSADLVGTGTDSNGIVATSVVVASGEADLTLDLGLFRPVSVGDRAWEDLNRNGIQDSGEPGVAGVTVTLFEADGTTPVTTDANGNSVTPQTTDATGAYLFGNLIPGQYVARFSNLPTGYLVTTSADVAGAGTDSNGLTATSTVLASGESDTTLDLGMFLPVSVGDYVWVDANHNGTQDAGESGLAGVTATLYAADGTTLVATDANGNSVTPQTTDATGAYLFAGLVPGQYVVKFTNLPTGYLVTTSADVAGAANDSNGLTATSATLTSGQSDLTLDLGVYLPVSVGDYVWVDANHNGAQDADETGMAGVTVTLYAADGTTLVTADATGASVTPQTTDATGAYLFGNLFPGQYVVKFTNLPTGYLVTTAADTAGAANDSNGLTATSTVLASGESDPTLDLGVYQPVSVGNYVWFDSNHNGTQDAGETGLSGVEVTLYAADGTTLIEVDATGAAVTPQTTDATGHYWFGGLLPGRYMVKFTNLPTGYDETMLTVSGDVAGADGDSNGLIATSLLLASGESDPSLDLGLFAESVIGDLVWHDANHNGIQDNGEEGVPGVTVTLYAADGTTVVTTDQAGNPVTPQTTDAGGHYLFTNLPNGSYVVKFTTIPNGYMVTTSADVAGVGSDSNGLTATSLTLPLSASDVSLDLGLYYTSTIGDIVWMDGNANGTQDTGEAGIAGVRVSIVAADGGTVFDVDGNPVGSTTTDASGHYQFTNLNPGDYVVVFDPQTTPVGSAWSTMNIGGSETDSNVTGSAGHTAVIHLGANTSDMTIDAGITPVSGAIKLIKFVNNNDANEAPGIVTADGTVTFRIVITNTGTAALTGLVLTDVVDGATSATINLPTTTLAPGASTEVTFTGRPLDVGEFHRDVATVTATAEDAFGRAFGPQLTATDPAHAYRIKALPTTGVNTVDILVIAALLLAFGVLLLAIRRRRKPTDA